MFGSFQTKDFMQHSPERYFSVLARVVRSRIEDRSINLCTRIEMAIFWSLRIEMEENRNFRTFLLHFWLFEAMVKSRIEIKVTITGQNNHS